MRTPEKATSLCSFCPKLCRYACPVADADQNEAVTPWGKMTAMKKVDNKELPMTPETMALAYKCTNCRASEHACELSNPVAPSLDAYRMRAFKADMAPEGVTEFCKKFKRHNNPYDRDLLIALQRAFPEQFENSPKGALKGRLHRALPVEGATRAPINDGTAYFPGCTEIVEDPKTVAKALDLLKLPLYGEPIQCCGYPLFAAGDWQNFTDLAEVNSHALNNYDRIVTGSPMCLYTLETLYKSAGHPVRAKVEHVSEYFTQEVAPSGSRLQGLPRPPSKAGHPASVAYHDPCTLGRYRKIYDEPRRLIERVSGKPPLEFLQNREDSYCCGGGGLLPVSFPETADAITRNRIAQFRETGAELLVTSCPTCVQRFRKFGVPTQSLVDYLSDEGQRKNIRRRQS